MTPFVTVIIPTYRDWYRLNLCLKSLAQQTYPLDKYEIIVVNNDPKDILPNDMILPQNCILTSEGKPGSYAARNRALMMARGEIVAFTDSDCIPHESWLKNAVRELNAGADRIAGNIELFYSSDNPNFAEVYEKAFAFDQLKNATNGISATANMITWRDNFDIVGLFNEKLMSGGDFEWGNRANDKGLNISFVEDVTVSHPARNSLKAILQKRKRVAGGSVVINSGNSYLILIVRGFTPPLRLILKAVKSKKLSIYEKFIVINLVYFIKVYVTFYKIMLKLGLQKPERV